VSAVGVWQGLWLSANAVSNIGTRVGEKLGPAGDVIDLVGSGLLLGAAWACARVVEALTRQSEPG
jgi:hypothetical protein